MTNGKLFMTTMAVAIVGIAAGIGLRHAVTDNEPMTQYNAPAGSIIGNHVPDFTLVDTEGNERTSSEWAGKIRVINFWATWCPPCRKEIPDFMALQQEYADRDVQFIGIALDDADRVQEFVDEFGVNYPNLLGTENTTALAKAYGNAVGALPYSVVLDRKGHVVATKPGELSKDQARQIFESLL